jgi:hypothetical protein
MRHRLPVSAAAMLLLSACTSHVDDLSFVSIEAWRGEDGPDNLQLHFRSDVNLRKLAERSDAGGAYARISLCPFRETPWIGIGRVLHKGIDIETKPTKTCMWRSGVPAGCRTEDDTPEVRAEIANVDEPGPYIYDARIVYDGRQWEDFRDKSGGVAQRRIVMPIASQDWCVQVHGPGMFGGFVSNEFRIPADALAKALATASPPRYHN